VHTAKQLRLSAFEPLSLSSQVIKKRERGSIGGGKSDTSPNSGIFVADSLPGGRSAWRGEKGEWETVDRYIHSGPTERGAWGKRESAVPANRLYTCGIRVHLRWPIPNERGGGGKMNDPNAQHLYHRFRRRKSSPPASAHQFSLPGRGKKKAEGEGKGSTTLFPLVKPYEPPLFHTRGGKGSAPFGEIYTFLQYRYPWAEERGFEGGLRHGPSGRHA